MPTFLEKKLETFRLVYWGLAPKGTLKYKKGKEIEEFLIKFAKDHGAHILEELAKGLPKIEDHICRFNDGECRCDCYANCLAEVKKLFTQRV